MKKQSIIIAVAIGIIGYLLQSWGESIRYFFTFCDDNKIDYLVR